VDGNDCDLLAKIWDYMGDRREMEDSKSVRVGLVIVQNESPVPIGAQDKTRTG
jgi:hypothetical protein